MLDSNMPMHDRRTGETATVSQHMGAQGGRTASQHADYFHNDTWMGGPAHADAHKAVVWTTGGHRDEAPRAVSQTHSELHFVDKHHSDPSYPSSMEREQNYRASLSHNSQSGQGR